MHPFARVTALAAIALVCLGVASPALAAGTYYVDTQHPSASNSNPGTEALPYKTISGAAAVRKGPGFILVVKPGVYRESVMVPASGALNNPYVFQASGPGVIVDGSDDYSGTSHWELSVGTVYRAASINWTPKQVFVDGVSLTPSTTAPESLPVNRFVFVPGGQGGLFVNLGGDNPGNHTTLVGRRLYGIRSSGRSYVTVEGFQVVRTEDRGIYFTNASNFGVARLNSVTNAYRYGIAVDASIGALIELNTVSYGQDHGIALTDSATGSTIRRNESFSNVHPVSRQANGIYLNRSMFNRIEGNRIHHNQDSGLQQNTDAHHNVAIQNLSWSNGDHGYDILNSTNATLIGCVAYGNYKDGFSIEGASSGAKVYNCIGVDNGINVLPADGTLEPNLWVDAQSSNGFQSDYNIWWNSTSLAPVKYINTWYSSLATFSAATGHDWNSKQMNPLFVDPANGNFELQPTSPAVDAATSGVAEWPALDALDRPRKDAPSVANTGVGVIAYADRGALEYQAAQPPVVAAPTTVSANEGQLLAFQVHAADPDGEALTSLVATDLPPGATFTPAPGDSVGTFSWTPGFNQAGPYSVTFTASNALSGSAGTTITVGNVDRAPAVAAPTEVAATEGQLVTFDVHAADPDGDGLTSLVATDLPAGATFTPAPGDSVGTFSWTPEFDQAGPHSITFTASNALSGSAVSSVPVSNVDRAPVVAAPTSVSANEGELVTFDVHAADPDSESFSSLTATNLPPGASFTPAPGDSVGTFTWAPSFNDAGEYPITFTAANALGGSAMTSLSVANVDRAPNVAAPTEVTATEGELVTFQVQAADADGDAIAALIATDLPAGATFTPEGTSVGTFSWTPGLDQAGPHTVTFTASNALSGSAVSTISVGNMDRAPVVAAPTSVSATEGELVTFDVHAADPDGEGFSSLTATNLPPGASFTPAPGDSVGTFTWAPSFNDAGEYPITFTATNALGGSAMTSLSVANVDRAPNVAAPTEVTATEGELVTFQVQAADADGDAIASLIAADLPAGATFTPEGTSVGTFSWTPGLDQAGPHTVTFTASNALSGSAVSTITVGNADQPPLVDAPSHLLATEGQLVTFDVHAVDPDGESLASLVATGLPAGASFTPAPGDSVGTFTWTPAFDQSGSFNVTFTASNALSGFAVTTISVGNVDRAPVVTAPAEVAVNEGQLLTFDVHAADPDGEGLTSLVATGLPVGATFTPAQGDSVGTFSWTPDFGQTGSFNVTFTAANALSGFTVTTISVGNVDRAPVVAAPSQVSVNEGVLLTFTVHAADPDGEGFASLVATGLPEGATFTPAPGDSVGTFSWTPAFGQSGNLDVTFTASNALSGDAITAITVGNVDRAPIVAAPTLVAVAEGQLLTFTVHAADPDGEGFASLVATGLPEGATFTPAPGDSVGTFSWTPAFGQSGILHITFTATNALSGSAVTTIAVGDVDRAPVVTVQANLTTNDGQLLSFQVHATDADGDSIHSLVATELPEGATFTPNEAHTSGTFVWTPSPSQAGQFTVTFTATNALTGSDSVSITVVAVTAVDPTAAIPARPILSPSPMRSRSTLSFYLPTAGPLEVGIHDIAGRLVRSVVNERAAEAGVHHLAIDGRSDRGEQLASGVYFFSIRTAQGIKTGRVVIAR